MSKIIITGASGFVGTRMFKKLTNRFEHEVFGTYHTKARNGLLHLDCSDYDESRQLFEKISPEIVIHLAGLSRSAHFRENPDQAIKTNVEGAMNMAMLCKEFGVKMVYLSTAHVFPNARGERYDEFFQLTDEHFDNYGKSKAESEKIIQVLLPDAIIIRTDLLLAYNNGGDSHLFGQILEGKASATSDKPRQPLLVDDLTDNILKLCNLDFTGTINIAGENVILYTELLQKLSQITNNEIKFNNVPINNGILLDTSKAKQLELKMSSLNDIYSSLESEVQNTIGENSRKLL